MSLAGRGIVVTRPRELGGALERLIEARGARAIVFPALEIERLPIPAALARLADFNLAVFISPSAVRIALPVVGAWPRHVAAAAVGSGTRRELERAGVARVIAPSESADSEALLALEPLKDMKGKRVLIVRGEGGRALLGETLRSRGAQVEYAECYRRAPPATDPADLLAQWRSGAVHAVTAFSAQGVDNLIAVAGLDLAAGTPFFVPHPRVASHAARAGIRQVVVAGAGDDQMIARLVAYFDERD